MKLSSSVALLLTLFALSSQAQGWKAPYGCAKVCVDMPWKYNYKCPKYCKTEVCYNSGKSGIKCVPKPKPSPSPSPLPYGCAKVCVATPWVYKYKCPYYCKTVDCNKRYKRGIKCVPKPTPSATPSPSPKPKPTCDEKCQFFSAHKVKKSCNLYHCEVKPCKKWLRYGYVCTKKTMKPKPEPRCPSKCMEWQALKAKGCDELHCSIDFCKKKYNGKTYAKCVPAY